MSPWPPNRHIQVNFKDLLNVNCSFVGSECRQFASDDSTGCIPVKLCGCLPRQFYGCFAKPAWVNSLIIPDVLFRHFKRKCFLISLCTPIPPTSGYFASHFHKPSRTWSNQYLEGSSSTAGNDAGNSVGSILHWYWASASAWLQESTVLLEGVILQVQHCTK